MFEVESDIGEVGFRDGVENDEGDVDDIIVQGKQCLYWTWSLIGLGHHADNGRNVLPCLGLLIDARFGEDVES